MLAAFFGDTHGNINTMYAMASVWEKRTGLTIDLVVQVGDFGFWLSEESVDKMTARHAKVLIDKMADRGDEVRAVCGDYFEYILGTSVAPKRTLVIRGNHEDQEYLMAAEKKLQADHPDDYLTRTIEMVPNMFYLPDGHVTEIDGVKFGALGGNYSYKTFDTWDYWDEARKKRLRYGEKRRLNHFTRDRWEALAREKMDVLLFHDAPQGMGLTTGRVLSVSEDQVLSAEEERRFVLPEDEVTEEKYGQPGCPRLNELIELVKPKHVFCGHWHQYHKKPFNINKHGTAETWVTVLNQTGLPPEHDCMVVEEL
jgi:Icc-related predicted phosphoesterase